jgi:hypothetical protein
MQSASASALAPNSGNVTQVFQIANPEQKSIAIKMRIKYTLNGSPTQYNRNEDPNVTVTNMTNSLRGVGINMDIPPHKLKQGHGSAECLLVRRHSVVTSAGKPCDAPPPAASRPYPPRAHSCAQHQCWSKSQSNREGG